MRPIPRLKPSALCTLMLLALAACNFAPPGFQQPGAAATPAEAGTGSGECANSYFPIIQGATWRYKVSGHISGELMRTITGTRADGFTDQHTTTNGTESMEWNCSDGLIAMQPDRAPSGLLPTGDVTADFHTTDTSGVTVPDNLGPGAHWNQESTLDGTASVGGQSAPAHNELFTECTATSHDSVPVPAGAFLALRADCRTDQKLTVTLNGAPITTEIVTISTIWYAPGVGMVKLQQAVANGPETTLELASYHIP